MKPQPFLIAFLLYLSIAPVCLNSGSSVNAQTEKKGSPDVYVGVDVAYENLTAIKQLIDEISSYTNLFVIGCTGITNSEIKLDETCQYLYDKGLSFIVYREWSFRVSNWFARWVESAKTQWGNKFLGFYYADEVGGKQLDQDEMVVRNAVNGADAANQFNNILSGELNRFTQYYCSNSTNFPLFTSDYALYWFDYKAGYNVLLSQFGWNYSRQLNVALCRGAATVQNKDWGAIITWEYTVPPYIESGEQLYKDLVLAYENGAKYIAVFDSNEEYTQTILKQEHLDALKQFWKYVQDNPIPDTHVNNRSGFVLPEGYAYGFRGPEDKIWGLWEANDFSLELSRNVSNMLKEFGNNLDIIYNERLQPSNNYGYSQLIYWNETTLFPSPSPSPPLFPMDYVYVMAGGIAIGTIALAAFVLRRRALKR
jgi:hypothetical protein